MTTPENEPIELTLETGQEPPKNRRRGLMTVLASAALVLVLLMAGGAYAGYQYLFGGEQPSERLPESLVAYVNLDFKPGLDQQRKLQNLARKFPKAVANGDGSQDVIGTLLKKLELEGINAEKDLSSWIGQRASAGVWMHGSQPYVLLAVSTTDHKAAVDALNRIVAKVKDASVGFVVNDGVAVIAIGDGGGLKAVQAAIDEAAKRPFTEAKAFAEARKWLDDDHFGALWIDASRAADIAKIMGGAAAEQEALLKAFQERGNKLQGSFALGIRATSSGFEAHYRTFGNKPAVSGTSDVLKKLGAQPADADVALSARLAKSAVGGDALANLLKMPQPAAASSLTPAEEAELDAFLSKDPESLTDAELDRAIALLDKSEGVTGPPLPNIGTMFEALSGATLAGHIRGLPGGKPTFQLIAELAAGTDTAKLDGLNALSGLVEGLKVNTTGNTVTLGNGPVSSAGVLADNAEFKAVTEGAPSDAELALFINVGSLTAEQKDDFAAVKAIGLVSGYQDGELAGSIRVLIG